VTLRSGRNPTRRNRNIGTPKSGHGTNNRLVIPARWSDDRVFYEKLGKHQKLSRDIHGHAITFIVESTKESCATPARLPIASAFSKLCQRLIWQGLGFSF